MISTRRAFATEVIKRTTGLGYAPKGAVNALVVQMYCENGKAPCTGVSGQGAAWNPLGDTQKVNGSTDYNTHIPPVQNYPGLQAGINAIALTLREPQFAGIFSLMSRRQVDVRKVVEAIGHSPWGTPLFLLEAVLADYKHDTGFYDLLTVGAA